MKKYHYLYKITNIINNKYYIGVHSTNNLDDKYFGSGTAIKNAIKKYGIENFKKEVIEFFDTAEEKWLPEIKYVTLDVTKDKNSYNMAPGGKNWIAAMKRENDPRFLNHQSKAGILGAKSRLSSLTEEEKKEWHSKGGKVAALKTVINKTGIHSDESRVKQKIGVSLAIKGTVELWHPDAPLTVKNRNCEEYKSGWSVRVKPNSDKFIELKNLGYERRL
jgi:glycine cleavage system H lipoate-binding protein